MKNFEMTLENSLMHWASLSPAKKFITGALFAGFNIVMLAVFAMLFCSMFFLPEVLAEFIAQ